MVPEEKSSDPQRAKMFDPAAAQKSDAHGRIHAQYEVIYTFVDFMAAILFVVGSVLFFWDSTQFAATWMFLIGSIFFALKPTTRLLRELAYLRLGKTEELERRTRP